jgi:hypothetical protein
MTAGYSKRSLVEKLGIKPGTRIALLNVPSNYLDTLGELPPETVILNKLGNQLDLIQFFTERRIELELAFPNLKSSLSFDGMLWISWPKRSSKVATDLNDNVVLEIGLSNNLVDIKVCAVDEIWSGLKFVFRVKDRNRKR